MLSPPRADSSVMLHLDAASHAASAVQAATEAMLAAGFGFGVGGGGGGGGGEGGFGLGGEDDGAGGMLPMGGANMAAQLALATAHTATAASSLSALPSSGFFASLRAGEGVDALDLIGAPQWRHAVVLESRHECQEFLIRWAGWSDTHRNTSSLLHDSAQPAQRGEHKSRP